MFNSLSERMHSVFLKLAVFVTGALLATVATMTYMTNASIEAVIIEKLADRVKSDTILLGEMLAGHARFEKTDLLDAELTEFLDLMGEELTSAAVFALDGAELAAVGEPLPQSVRALIDEAIRADTLIFQPDTLWTAEPLHYGAENEVVGVVVARWSNAKFIARFEQSSREALLLAAIVSILGIAAVTFAVMRLAARPLSILQKDIARLKNKDFGDGAIPLTRRDEFGIVARALDALRKDLSVSEAAQREVEFKSAAINCTSVAIMVVNADFVITQISPRLAAFFETHEAGLRKMRPNFDRHKIVGMNLKDFHGEPAMEKRMQSLGANLLEGIVKLEDSRLSITTAAVHDTAGNVSGYVVEWRDITESWRQQSVLSTIEDIQIKAEFDMSGHPVQVNDRALRALSSDGSTMPALMQLLEPQAAQTGTAVQDILASLRAGQSVNSMLKLASGKGARFVDGSLSCIRDSDGTGLRYLILGTDVTEKVAENEAARVERDAAEAEKSDVVNALGIGLRQLSDGDLTAAITRTFPGQYEALRTDFNATVQKLAGTMREIAESAENIRNESGDITNTADSLSRRTESTAATLEETAAALDGLTEALRAAADGATRADSVVGEAHRKAAASGEVVIETVSAMDQIASSSEQITSIIRVIDDIAFQTNLLALNAGVEAARAGEAGRGFAVVASEVRALAQRSSEAAREINGLIADSGGQVKKGVELVGQTGQALRDIVASVTEIAGLVSEIADSSRSQSLSLEEINVAVNKLDQSTQQNAARLEETTAASEALRNNAVSLVETISHFRTGGLERARPAPVATKPRAVVGGVPMSAAAPASGEVAKWMDF